MEAGGGEPGARTDRPLRETVPGGLDQCGLTQLAGRTVGAPFVGALAAAIVIGEVLRAVNGAMAMPDRGHLRELKYLTVVDAVDGVPINPGSTRLARIGIERRASSRRSAR